MPRAYLESLGSQRLLYTDDLVQPPTASGLRYLFFISKSAQRQAFRGARHLLAKAGALTQRDPAAVLALPGYCKRLQAHDSTDIPSFAHFCHQMDQGSASISSGSSDQVVLKSISVNIFEKFCFRSSIFGNSRKRSETIWRQATV